MKNHIILYDQYKISLAISQLVHFERICLALLLSFFSMQSEASAYLDPGTGSFVLQFIAATVVAVGFFARKFWNRITSFFIHKKPNSNDGKDQ